MDKNSYKKVLELETKDALSKLHYVMMWECADIGDFEMAMTNQLLHLVYLVEWEELWDKFDGKDWATSCEMLNIATDGVDR